MTCAGVSAGIDLALWLAGQIGGEAKAKAIQLAIEYDPQPPFDSGHLSKASAATKATATAMLSKETVKHRPARRVGAAAVGRRRIRARPREAAAARSATRTRDFRRASAVRLSATATTRESPLK